MKKQLLFLASAAFALTAVANTPIYIKHHNQMVPNFDNGKDLRSGNALWYEPSGAGDISEKDLEIKCVANGDGAAVGNYGFQFETRSWKIDTPEAECVKPGENIIAFEYKTNTISTFCQTYTIDLGAGGVLNGAGCGTGGRVLSVSDQYQTAYVLIETPASWAQAGAMNATSECWVWIRFSDINHEANPDFEVYVKNFRLLTPDEAKADIEANFNPANDIYTSFTPTNDGFAKDITDEGQVLYMLQASQDDSFNPVMHSTGMLYALPESHDIFAFDYQTTGEFGLNLYMWCPGMNAVGMQTIEEKYELDGEEWGTIKFPCKDAIQQYAFAQQVASGHYLWLQCPPTQRDAAEGQIFYMENPRWTSEKNLSGIENITADNAEGEVSYYNLQGIKVNNPANGLYIKKQGNTTTKVLVK